MGGFTEFKVRVATPLSERVLVKRAADSVNDAIMSAQEGKCTTIHVPPSRVDLYRACIPTEVLGMIAIIGSDAERAGTSEDDIMKALDFCPTCGWARGSHSQGPKKMIACSCPAQRKKK